MPAPINDQRNTSNRNPFARTFGIDWASSHSADGTVSTIDVHLPLPQDNSANPVHLVVGRVDTADIRVMDPLLSRRHFEFVRQGGHWFARDLNSKNGAELNGSPLTGHLHPVESGHRISAGTSIFLVTIDDSAGDS